MARPVILATGLSAIRAMKEKIQTETLPAGLRNYERDAAKAI
jgi:hypothetical protein